MSENQVTADETALWQRRLASQANNRCWSLSELAQRTPQEDEEMLQAAHAAMYFWNIAGKAKNHAHAAQLVAHVYALLQLPNPAKYYLAKAQPVFFGTDVEPWELALAHAVVANVAAASRDDEVHVAHYIKAQRLIEALTSDEERNIIAASLRVVPVPRALQ